ncbi:MAG: hypothetical protein NWF06_02520 [Candidatus Bathyarchaeota archaeon]|nr:hypothetical protein [Candidatus Bathyarchaeum sp.]
MKRSNKILLMWLSVMWTVFSIWVVAVTQFPLNFGFVGLQSIVCIVLVWTMIQYNNIGNDSLVPSE